MTTSASYNEIDTIHWLYGVPVVDQDVKWPIADPEATELFVPADV